MGCSIGLDRKVALSRGTEEEALLRWAATGFRRYVTVSSLLVPSCCDLEVVPLLISFYLIDHMSI